MKKIVLLSSFLFLIVGCDPLYHLNYVVSNQSNKTICVVNKQPNDSSKRIVYLKPGTSDTLIKISGVGYAKPVFQSNTKDIIKALVFFSDSTMCDSCVLAPKGDWDYSESNRCEGTANLIVNSSDVKK